jgi:hypothetical protein
VLGIKVFCNPKIGKDWGRLLELGRLFNNRDKMGHIRAVLSIGVIAIYALIAPNNTLIPKSAQ